MNKAYLNLIGLAFRAGKCVIGEENIVKGIRKNEAKLLLIASDCSEATKKKLTDKCKTYEVPFVEADSRDVLSQSIGKMDRVAIAIIDQGFAKGIQQRFHK